MVRVISGDNELQAIDFQKHYQMPAVYLMDPDRSFERQYNRDGWPFLMLVNEQGEIVYQCNNLVERDKTLMENLHEIGNTQREPEIRYIGDTPYLLTTLKNNGEAEKTLTHERFTSIACGTNGDIYTVYTSVEEGNSNVYLKISQTGEKQQTIPVAATDADEYDGTVLCDNPGQIWVCWTSNSRGKTYNIYLNDLKSIQENNPSVLISQSKEDAMHGRMAADASNNIWITYYKWEKIKNISRDKEVYVRKYANGRISEEIHISPEDVSQYEDHTDPSIAILNDQPVICWSWDFHRPEGYTKDAESPTIFARAVSRNLQLQKPFHVSGKNIDMTPALGSCGDLLWCAWDCLERDKKSLRVRCINANNPSGTDMVISSNLVNVCSPGFAFYSNTQGVLIWSQTENGEAWTLWKSDYDALQKTWINSSMIVSAGDPRFGSCAYDKDGNLWLAYSVKTEDGRKIIVQQSN